MSRHHFYAIVEENGQEIVHRFDEIKVRDLWVKHIDKMRVADKDKNPVRRYRARKPPGPYIDHLTRDLKNEQKTKRNVGR